MKKTKRTKAVAMLLILALLTGFMYSCGEYKPPVGGDEEDDGGVKHPVLDDDPTNDFTVTLMKDGQPFIPGTAIDVYWNDGYDIHVAPIGSDGVARIDGLDGDYRVVLSTTPSGYAYDPNGYKATNNSRNVVIEIYDLNPVLGGNSVEDIKKVDSTGVYSVTITEPGQQVFFEYSPQTNGTYTIESWVSVADDEVNPICTSYTGSIQAGLYGSYRVTDYGEIGSFTHNFIHTVNIADENIAGVGNSLSFIFSVSAEAKSGVYPVTYSFAIKKNGGFSNDREDKVMIPAKADWSHFDFDAFNALAGGTLVGAKTLFKDENGNEKEGAWVYDQRNYRLWKISEGGDGVYHVYDEEKYASTGGYGPILVAYITESCGYLDAFTKLESNQATLTVNGFENHKQFIEGWDGMLENSPYYYCEGDCPCRAEAEEKGEIHHACPPSCTKCKCRKCPEEMMGAEGYADWVNDDGVAPVTEELVHFMQSLCTSQGYFIDGEGFVEKKTGANAYEDSQWLFACAYYAD